MTERKEGAEPIPPSISGQSNFSSPPASQLLHFSGKEPLVLSYLPIQVQAQAASAPSPTCLLTVSVLVCLESGLPFRGVLVQPPPSMRASRRPDLRK
uniref:Uncharacterized protein n=1 Tax=Aegilops tauschii subsp. strangulata TaxID=200361 RepID=A0A453BV82_AEGTS